MPGVVHQDVDLADFLSEAVDGRRGVFEVQGLAFTDPDFRGCAFVSASADARPGGVVDEETTDYRAWLHSLFFDLAEQAGATSPKQLARDLVLLYDGAGISAWMDRDPSAESAARSIAASVATRPSRSDRSDRRATARIRPPGDATTPMPSGTPIGRQASLKTMKKREEPVGVAGCLVAVVGACVGFGVWLHGSRPGLRGGFEGERDWRLLWLDMPLMVFGLPALALAAWTLTGLALRGWDSRGTRAAVSGVVVVVLLTVLAWACQSWLDVRIDGFLDGDGGARAAGLRHRES